jgi:hypothetical protein
MGSTTERAGGRRLKRGLRGFGLAAVLLLLVAAPVLAAAALPTSSSTYVFAPSGAQGAAGLWQKSTQYVSVTASPSADSTVTAHFSADGGVSWATRSAANTRTATWSFVVDDEGSNEIQFYASDTSRATEAPVNEPGYVNIDRTDPAISAASLETTSTQSEAAGWSQDTTGTVTFTATDTAPAPGVATSGLQQISRTVNGGTAVVATGTATVSYAWAKGSAGVVEGSNTVVYSARDWAGNSVSKTGFINIDTVAPATTPSPALASSPTTGWRSSEVTVTLNWLDVSSGVPPLGTVYRVDDTPNPTVYLNPFPVTAEKSTRIEYRSFDRAGNLEATQTAYVNIDKSVPTAGATTAPAGNDGWYNTDVTVTLSGSGSPSGTAKTQYRLDAEPPLAWLDAASNQFTVPAAESGFQTYEYRAINGAGTASAAESLELKIDTVKPQASGKDASGKKNKSITLKYKFTDNLSPKIETVYVKITNSKGKVVATKKFTAVKNVKTWYSFTWKTSTKGTYKYYMHGSDLAGNTSTTKPAKITVK